MGKSCKVAQCKNESTEKKLSTFSVPNLRKEREKWSQILNCDLDDKAVVCEKHFDPNDIKSNEVYCSFR